jgi:uncharacterized membrane protein (DUF485 family)
MSLKLKESNISFIIAKETYFKNFTNKQQSYNVSLTLLFLTWLIRYS